MCPVESEDLGAGLGVPDLHLVLGYDPFTQSSHPVTIRDPSGLNDADRDEIGVPLEREDLGAGPGVPDLRRLVARGDDPRPVRAEHRLQSAITWSLCRE